MNFGTKLLKLAKSGERKESKIYEVLAAAASANAVRGSFVIFRILCQLDVDILSHI